MNTWLKLMVVVALVVGVSFIVFLKPKPEGLPAEGQLADTATQTEVPTEVAAGIPQLLDFGADT